MKHVSKLQEKLLRKEGRYIYLKFKKLENAYLILKNAGPGPLFPSSAGSSATSRTIFLAPSPVQILDPLMDVNANQ